MFPTATERFIAGIRRAKTGVNFPSPYETLRLSLALKIYLDYTNVRSILAKPTNQTEYKMKVTKQSLVDWEVTDEGIHVAGSLDPSEDFDYLVTLLEYYTE